MVSGECSGGRQGVGEGGANMEGMGQCEPQDGQAAWELCVSRADARSPAGLKCPGYLFPGPFPASPQHALHPQPDAQPLHACSHSHVLPLSSPPPGLEQLRKLRHLDVAYNLLEEHRALAPLCLLAELRKVRLGHFKDREASLAPPPLLVLMWSVPFLPQGRSDPPLSPSCSSALPGGKPFVVPPCTPSGHHPVLVTPGQGCCFGRE